MKALSIGGFFCFCFCFFNQAELIIVEPFLPIVTQKLRNMYHAEYCAKYSKTADHADMISKVEKIEYKPFP